MKNDELSALRVGIVNCSKDLLNEHDVNGDISDKIIDTLDRIINIYKQSK